MNHIKNAVQTSKNFVATHRVAIAFTAGASLGIVLNKLALSQHDEFLKEHGLYDEFYTPTDDEN